MTKIGFIRVVGHVSSMSPNRTDIDLEITDGPPEGVTAPDDAESTDTFDDDEVTAGVAGGSGGSSGPGGGGGSSGGGGSGGCSAAVPRSDE